MSDHRLVERLHRQVVDGHRPGPVALEALRELARHEAPLLSDGDLQAVVAAVVARIEGLGPLQALLARDDVTDILVNGPGPVWVEAAGRLRCTDIELTRDDVELVVERVLSPLDRRADRSRPITEARLPDGSRVHVVMAPVAVEGPLVAIRRFAPAGHPLSAFAPPPVVDLLRGAVGAGRNLVVSGGTGTGKTTLLGALAAHIAADERVVTIEDAAELRLPGRHVVRLETRPSSPDGPDGIDLGALVRAALRLRPDRLVVGEIRGTEAFDLVQALNTGHDGSMATCHANDPVSALRRLESLAVAGMPAVPVAVVRSMLVGALDLVVHVARADGDRRRVVAVHEVHAGPGGDLVARPIADAHEVRAALSRPLRRPS